MTPRIRRRPLSDREIGLPSELECLVFDATRVTLHVSTDNLRGATARRLRKVLMFHPGPSLVCLDITDPKTGVHTTVAVKDTLKVSADDAFASDLARRFPEVGVSLG